MPMRPPVHQPLGSARKPRQVAKKTDEAGYDYAWKRLRLIKLKAEPLCRFCMAKGVIKPADCVDYIYPIEVRPELRLVLGNLRSLCTPCHNSHTASGAWRSRLAD